MREEGYDMTGKGCSDSLLSHPGTPVALSESHDWNKGCRHKYDETLSGTAVKQNLHSSTHVQHLILWNS